jgi:hypothetical protein
MHCTHRPAKKILTIGLEIIRGYCFLFWQIPKFQVEVEWDMESNKVYLETIDKGLQGQTKYIHYRKNQQVRCHRRKRAIAILRQEWRQSAHSRRTQMYANSLRRASFRQEHYITVGMMKYFEQLPHLWVRESHPDVWTKYSVKTESAEHREVGSEDPNCLFVFTTRVAKLSLFKISPGADMHTFS